MSSGLTFNSSCHSDTVRLGQAMAEVVMPGCVIALNGDLGAGKTGLVRAMCLALGVDESVVNSPTFVLMQLYTDGRIPVAHFDTYRLADCDEFLAIGGDEYLDCGEFVCLIEWADRVADVLPADRLTVDIAQTGEQSREFVLRASGPNAESLLQRLHVVLPDAGAFR